MAAIVWEDVTAFESTLCDIDPVARTIILSRVNSGLDADAIDGESGPRTRMARIFLAVHLGASSLASLAASGPAKKDKAGALEREYAVATSDAGLKGTAAGRQYLAIINASLARAPVVLT